MWSRAARYHVDTRARRRHLEQVERSIREQPVIGCVRGARYYFIVSSPPDSSQNGPNALAAEKTQKQLTHPRKSAAASQRVRCPACNALIGCARLKVHRRSSNCPGRPLPPPERCALCGEPWPCVSCEIRAAVAILGAHDVKRIAAACGVSVTRVHRELGRLAERARIAARR